MSDHPDVEAYLLSKGIQFKKNATQLITTCFIHGQDPADRDPHLYINYTPTDKNGLYDCKSRGCKGNFRTLRRWFGDDDDTPSGPATATTSAIIRKAAELYYRNLRDADVEWLKNARGLTEETIKARGLGHTPGGKWLYVQLKDDFSPQELLDAGVLNYGAAEKGEMRDHFSRSGITIPYFTGQGDTKKVVTIRWRNTGGEGGPKYMSLAGSDNRLFNTNTAWGAQELMITEGEFDAMILEQLGYRAVAMPGSDTWRGGWAGYFEDADRVWIVGDPDDAGKNGSDKVEASLGTKAKIVNLPIPDGVEAKKVDPTYLVVHEGWTKNHFDFLLKQSRRAASFLWTIDDCWADFVQDEGKGIKTGWRRLDALLPQGLKRGSITIFGATTNTGKTALLLNLFQNIGMTSPDAKLLMFSVEPTRGEFYERARMIWAFHNYDCPIEDVDEEFKKWWRGRVFVDDRTRLREDDVRRSIEDFEMEMGKVPDVVAIDYLQFFAKGMPGSNFYEKSSFAMDSLKAIGGDYRLPLVVPSQMNRSADAGSQIHMSQMKDSSEIEQTADTVISVWSPDATIGKSPNDPRTGDLEGAIDKCRGGRKGHKLHFRFGPLTNVIVEREEADLLRRVTDEVRWSAEAETDWRHAITAWRTGLPLTRQLG